MAFNGSGTFVRIYNWVADKAAGIKVLADRMDAEMDGFADGLSNCITKDGQTTITANIPFNNKKITGLADATADTDAVNKQSVAGLLQSDVSTWIGTAGGTADVLTGTVTPTLTAYTTGQSFVFEAAANNTGAATLNIDSVGAVAIKRADGTTALSADMIVAGYLHTVTYDGTNFVLGGGGVTAFNSRTGAVVPAASDYSSTQIAMSATDRLIGRQTAGAGVSEEITCTAAGRALIDDASASAQRTTLELDTVSQAEAEAGTATTTRAWTAQRVSQAIAALAASSTTTNLQTFTSSGTWTKPAGVDSSTLVLVWVWGGGGGGGEVAGGDGGGGGGGGACSFGVFRATELGSTVSVTIGSGGAGATATTSNGGTGGTSSFGSHLSAYGGGGGSGSSTSGGGGGGGGGSLAGSVGGTSAGGYGGGTSAGGDSNSSGAGSNGVGSDYSGAGGGGGGSTTGGNGGYSTYGGAGGGGGGGTGAGSGGVSKFGGNGGAGATASATGGAGVAPGGGGGGSESGNAGSGAAGRCEVITLL